MINRSKILARVVTTHITVLTTKGPIKGQETIIEGEMMSMQFLGIAYAKPPLGHLRFQNPFPTDEWTNVVTVTNSTWPCLALDLNTNIISGDENCLYLDIYTGQSTHSTDPLPNNHWPVLVAFQGPLKHQINPSTWLYRKIVLVIVAYRLQIFGYLTPSPTTTPPGILDQIRALEWIHENIIGFGGDPDQVTIIGEDQTGNDVTTLLFTPQAKGLFMGAGIISAPLGTIATSTEVDEADAIQFVASRVDCPQSSLQETIECLRRKNGRDLIQHQHRFSHIFGPIRLNNLHCLNQVSMIIAIASNDAEKYKNFGEDILKIILKNYGKLKNGIQEFYGNKSITSDMIFDGVFYAPAIEMLKAHAQHATSFLYELSYEHPLTMLEMILNGFKPNLSVDDHVVRSTVVTLWTNFIINGRPSISDLPNWEPFTPSTKPKCHEINVDSKSPPSCRRINQISFWKAIHIFDDSLTDLTASQNPKTSFETDSTGCATAVTILTIICIFLFAICLCVRHSEFRDYFAETLRNLRTRLARRRIPQTEV